MKRPFLRRPSTWIGFGLSALLLVIAGTSTGVGGMLIMAGLIGLGTGVYTLVTRRGSWLGLAGRKAGAGVAIAALVVTCVGSGVYAATGEGRAAATHPSAVAAGDATERPVSNGPTPASAASSEPSRVASAPSPTPTAATATPRSGANTALALLETLPVKGRAPKTGYDRAVVFGPAWQDVDRNGCDTRNDILRRDLKRVAVKADTHGCVVLTGTLTDPYSGTSIAFTRGQGTSTAVQIDHVVALMDAWQSGAQQLSQDRREELANDPVNLLAVSGPVNASKGAGNAATWLPPSKSYRCAYVARQVTVKAKYGLWVTAAEHDAIARILHTCPEQKVASAGSILLMPDAVAKAPAPKVAPSKPAPRETVAPKPAPKKPVAPKPAAPTVVHPGAYCTPVGARGVTSKGTPMVCSVKAGQDRARWRRG